MSAPLAMKPRKSYSDAASTMTGTPRVLADGTEFGKKMDLAVLYSVMGDHIDGGCCALADPAGEMIGARVGSLTNRDHFGTRQTNSLLDRRAVIDHVPRLDQYLVFHASGIRQMLDTRQVGAGHVAGDSDRDAGGA